MNTFNESVLVNPSDLFNSKRVRITQSHRNTIAKFIDNFDITLKESDKNTLAEMILLNKSKKEKLKTTGIRIAMKFLVDRHIVDTKEKALFVSYKKNGNVAVLIDLLNSPEKDFINDVFKNADFVPENISQSFVEHVNIWAIKSLFLKGAMHPCARCGKYTLLKYCSVQCVHYDDLSDLKLDTSIDVNDILDRDL